LPYDACNLLQAAPKKPDSNEAVTKELQGLPIWLMGAFQAAPAAEKTQV